MRPSRAVVLGLWLSCALCGCTKNEVPIHDEDAATAEPVEDASTRDAQTTADAGGDSVFDAGSDPDRNKAVPGELCARIAAIQCAGEVACCDAPGRDRAACTAAREQACADELALDALATAPEVGFELESASAVLSELERRASTCDPQIAAWFASPEGLPACFAGTLGKNDECGPDDPENADDDAQAIALASCQQGAGIACLPDGDTWTCVPRSSPANRCHADINCADGLFCADPVDAADGLCQERLADGEPCERAGQCITSVCHAGTCAADDDEQAAYCP